VSAQCATACNLTCGASATWWATPDAAAGCVQCFLSSACGVLTQYAANPTCQASQWCQTYARTFDTSVACRALLDAGVLDAAALSAAAAACFTVCGSGATWSCVGRVTWPSLQAKDTLSLSLHVTDAVHYGPVSGVTARICSPVDPACTSSFATAVTDSDGDVTLVQALDASFTSNGYVDLADGGIVPILFFWSAPLSQQHASLGQNIVVITPSDFQTFEATNGIDADVGLGSIYVVGFDCTMVPALGVTFSVAPSGGAHVLYGTGASAFDPAATSTASKGNAFISNVAPGEVELTMRLAGGVVASRVTVIVRPGEITQVFMPPTP
jgi:hypothetical protein